MTDINKALENITELSAEELSALKDSIISEYKNVKESEPTRDVVDRISELSAAAQAIVAETGRREAEKAELTAAMEDAGSHIAALETPAEAETAVDGDEASASETEDLADDEEIDPVTGKKRKKDDAPVEEVVEASVSDHPESVKAPEESVTLELSVETPEGAEAALGEESRVTAKVTAETSEHLDKPEVDEAEKAEDTDEEKRVEGAEAAPEVAVQPEETVEVEASAETESIDTDETGKDSGETVTAAAENNENLVVEVPENHRPQVQAAKAPVTITAGADIPGYSAGTQLPNLRAVAQAIVDRRKGMGRTTGGDGEQHTVATFSTSYPEARILDNTDVDANEEKIKAVVSHEAITAAGGLLGPIETNYDFFGLEENLGRPVRDSLAVFNADRGGIRFLTAPVLNDLEGAASVWTIEMDEAAVAGDPVKPCLRVTAATTQEVYVDAIPLCLTYGNMGARFFPELVERHTKLGLMYHARYAEQRLIARIGSLSTQVSTTAELGAARDFLVALEKAAAGYRNRHRMDVGARLRVILPEWFRNALRADLTKQIPGADADDSINLTDARLNAWFDARGVNVTWTQDGEAGQYFGAQANGALVDFPSTVVWYLFAEGTWLFLDGGTLDLGLVRDSTLNGTNDYKIFLETFEGVAKVGVESLRITTPVRLYGATAATVDTVA